MNLPINDLELKEIIAALNPQSKLYEKLHLIMEVREVQQRQLDAKENAGRFGFII